nr:MAG TPA: hypothetical protein [Caudoviricetes sp.]
MHHLNFSDFGVAKSQDEGLPNLTKRCFIARFWR